MTMQLHTSANDLCQEPFSGSGSQLIAAEQLGRRCYAIELERFGFEVGCSLVSIESSVPIRPGTTTTGFGLMASASCSEISKQNESFRNGKQTVKPFHELADFHETPETSESPNRVQDFASLLGAAPILRTTL